MCVHATAARALLQPITRGNRESDRHATPRPLVPSTAKDSLCAKRLCRIGRFWHGETMAQFRRSFVGLLPTTPEEGCRCAHDALRADRAAMMRRKDSLSCRCLTARASLHRLPAPLVARVDTAEYARLLLLLSMTYTGQERRGADRLRDGARRACPQCGGVVEFRERYLVLSDGHRAIPAPQPAWICLTIGCGYRELVRRADSVGDRGTVSRGGRRKTDANPPVRDPQRADREKR